MNESSPTELKIVVERAVRHVQASISCKRKMRDELLAHVSSVFEQELSQLDDEHIALERTALRFGNPTEVMRQLQDSVPVGDLIARFWEGRPGESMLWLALRFVSFQTVVGLAIFGAALFAAGWDRAWSREEVMAVCSNLVFLLPVLFGITLIVCCMGKAFCEARHLTAPPPVGWVKSFASAWAIPAVRRVMIVGGLCQFLLLMAVYVGANWPARPWDRDQFIAILETVPAMAFKAGICVFAGLVIVWPGVERRRHHEEWSCLTIEPTLWNIPSLNLVAPGPNDKPSELR